MPPLSHHLQRRRLSKIQGYVRGAVLDLGCGDGSLLKWLSPDQPYTGVEIRADLVRELQQSGLPHRFVVADLDSEDLALEPQVYDTIVMSAIIEHLRMPGRVLASLARLLADDGRVVITTPTHLGDLVHRLGATVSLFSREAEKEHQRIFDKRSLELLLRECGFATEHYETFDLGLNQLCIAVPEVRLQGKECPP
jgi:2-polyprenyl-3-methyl-5-hydroxy-6-metoxy-1,4-benzoquinol methylase